MSQQSTSDFINCLINTEKHLARFMPAKQGVYDQLLQPGALKIREFDIQINQKFHAIECQKSRHQNQEHRQIFEAIPNYVYSPVLPTGLVLQPSVFQESSQAAATHSVQQTFA